MGPSRFCPAMKMKTQDAGHYLSLTAWAPVFFLVIVGALMCNSSIFSLFSSWLTAFFFLFSSAEKKEERTCPRQHLSKPNQKAWKLAGQQENSYEASDMSHEPGNGHGK